MKNPEPGDFSFLPNCSNPGIFGTGIFLCFVALTLLSHLFLTRALFLKLLILLCGIKVCVVQRMLLSVKFYLDRRVTAPGYCTDPFIVQFYLTNKQGC